MKLEEEKWPTSFWTKTGLKVSMIIRKLLGLSIGSGF